MSVFIIVLIVGPLMWMWFGTGYKIEDGLIKTRCGPFRSTVNIKEIKKLGTTRNPLSAPALSLDRMEIKYGVYRLAIVSPKDKAEFIRVLLLENPDIQIDNNLRLLL